MSLVIGPLNEADLDDADSIFRLSFARFYGLADPAQMFGDIDYVRTRWRTAPNAAFGAFLGGRLIGSNFAVRWGSVGFIGPLTLHPDYWGRGFSPRLIQATLDLLAVWGVEAVGLFTFPQSPLHLHLYQKFDFWPRFLTVILTRPAKSPQPQVAGAFDLSESDSDCKQVFREFADAIYPGLDLWREIDAVRRQGLGQVVTLRDSGTLAGMAICHFGPGTEAGSGTCYVKFGGVRPGPGAGSRFDSLLDACNWLASGRGLNRIVLGINTACHDAHLRALSRGYRSEKHGVSMYLRDHPAFHRPDCYVISDWR